MVLVKCIKWVLIICFTLVSVSCDFFIIDDMVEAWIENNEERKYQLNINRATIYLNNGTDDVLYIEYNRRIYGCKHSDEVIFAEVPSSYYMVCHIDDLTYINKRGKKKYKDSQSLYDIDDDYCRKYLRDLRDDSYIKIYNTDSVLLKEWDIRSYDPAEPNPFDCNYYDYSLYDEQYGTYHEWVFVITEDMLNR